MDPWGVAISVNATDSVHPYYTENNMVVADAEDEDGRLQVYSRLGISRTAIVPAHLSARVGL
jgi:carbohydrate-selective porin OprB